MKVLGIRVRIELSHNNNSAVTTALVNSGYESDVPEVHIPLSLARKLGFLLEAMRSERYRAVGVEVSTYVLGDVNIRIVVEDRKLNWTVARAVTVVGEYEVILSDALIEALGLEIVKPKSGVWKLRDEEKLRSSLEPEYWVN